MLWSLIITLAIISGQLPKLSIGYNANLSLLDTTIGFLCIFGFIRLRFQLKKTPKFIIFALLFTVVAIISLILTPLHLQFAEYLVSSLYILRFSLYILFAWLVCSEAFRDFKNKINETLIYSGLGLVGLGLMQFIFLPDLDFISKMGWDPHYFRTVSTFLDPNFAGAFFVLTLLLLSKKTKIFYIITYLALLTTFSRSSYLMFLVSGLTFSILEKSKKEAAYTILLFVILLLSFQAYTQFVSEPRNIDREQSASSRLNTWQQGWQLFSYHPILGIGFNAYRFAIREYNLGDEKFIKSHGSTSNDSSLLFVLATTGIIGLVSYLCFLFTILVYSNNRNTAPVLLGLLVHSIFSNSLFFPPILLWLILISIAPKK